MTEDTELTKKKCPFCAELILREAIKCRFCQSDLTGVNEKKPVEVSMGRAILLNLVCPGGGAWALGHRLRGALIFVAITGSIFYYFSLAVPLINKQVANFVKTGQTKGLYDISKEMDENPWLELSFYAYLFSFVDIYFLVKSNKSKSGSVVGHEST